MFWWVVFPGNCHEDRQQKQNFNNSRQITHFCNFFTLMSTLSYFQYDINFWYIYFGVIERKFRKRNLNW